LHEKGNLLKDIPLFFALPWSYLTDPDLWSSALRKMKICLTLGTQVPDKLLPPVPFCTLDNLYINEKIFL
jgi:hypothetical protein